MATESANVWTKNWCAKNGITYEYHKLIGSTNDQAKKDFVDSGHSLKVYLTENQSEGRGRGDRKWHNVKEGGTLLSTWCFGIDHVVQPIFSPLVGLSVFKALENTWTHLNFSMKAPNDIYLDEGKLAGLLIESVLYRGKFYAMIGLGLNVLSSPTIKSQKTSDIKSFDEVNERVWHFFCSQLLQNFNSTLEESIDKSLNRTRRNELKRALNLNPNLEEKLEEISPDGDLVFSNQRISWLDL